MINTFVMEKEKETNNLLCASPLCQVLKCWELGLCPYDLI